jgi:hypothetical protein
MWWGEVEVLGMTLQSIVIKQVALAILQSTIDDLQQIAPLLPENESEIRDCYQKLQDIYFIEVDKGRDEFKQYQKLVGEGWMALSIIKEIGDFKIVIRDEQSTILGTPIYRIWIHSDNESLQVPYMVSAKIVNKKSIEVDRVKINKSVGYFEKVIVDYYNNQNDEKTRLMKIMGESHE